MKKILFVSNHLQSGDGVCRTLTTLVNALAETNKYDITISFMLRFDKSLLPLFDKRIKIRHAFHLPCFKGLDRLMSYLPGKFLYKKVSKKEKYDIEVGYCWRNPTIAISNSINKEAKHILFTHGFVSAKNLYLKNDALLGCSSESVNLLKEDVQNAIPIFHFPNIFNEQDILNYANESPLFSKREGRFLFITVGRLTIEKGLDRMMNAAQKLYDEGYDFDIWHVGEGKDRKLIENFIAKHHLEEKVILLGNQPNPYPYMKQADILVCPSLSEGYSTVSVESCILEVPVISTEVSGAHDIINDANAGKVVPNSEEGIYEGMKYILDNKKELSTWKNNLKETKTKFFKEQRINKLLNIFDEVEGK